MNQSKKSLYAVVVVLLIALGVYAGAMLYGSNQPTDQSQTTTTPPATESDEDKPGRTELSYKATPGITSLEQLKSEAKDVVVTTSEYGELVDSIEGHKGGTDGKYWSFYVNGEMAQVGAGTYVQKEGDVIEWKFQKL